MSSLPSSSTSVADGATKVQAKPFEVGRQV
jgi:hypothetical protein